MKCPIDKSKLQPMMKSGDFGQHCQTCKGVFLAKKSIDTFKHNYQTELNTLFTPTTSIIVGTKSCPACSNLMDIRHIDIIELDCCENCGGIWFDPNELKQIINQHGSLPMGPGEAFLAFFPWWPTF